MDKLSKINFPFFRNEIFFLDIPKWQYWTIFHEWREYNIKSFPTIYTEFKLNFEYTTIFYPKVIIIQPFTPNLKFTVYSMIGEITYTKNEIKSIIGDGIIRDLG